MPEAAPLQGKVAVVTGAGGGIGRAYARGLAEAGASVVLADIAIDPARAAAADLERDGYAAMSVEVDVTDEASVGAMARAAADRFGSVGSRSRPRGAGPHLDGARLGTPSRSSSPEAAGRDRTPSRTVHCLPRSLSK